MEVVLTVGMEGGKTLLAGAPPEVFRVRTVGPAAELPKEFATRFYEVSIGDKTLAPDTIAVRSDGLEFAVLLKFLRPAGNALAVRAVFLDKLPSKLTSSFVMTDEVGNIFAGKVLSRGDAAIGLTLPTVVTAETAVVESAPSVPAKNPVATAQPVLQPSVAPTVASADNSVLPDKQSGIKPGYNRWLVLAGLLAVVLGSFVLKRRNYFNR